MATFTLEAYDLYRDGGQIIKWASPDGQTHELPIDLTVLGQWLIIDDSTGKHVMALRQIPGQDAELAISLDGAKGISATLLHNEDDRPRKLYYATDSGNNNPLGGSAFILRCEGLMDSPIAPYARYQVLVVRIT